MSRNGAYFETTKKGEMHELKNELNSLKESTKKEAVKKVIAHMTVGKDVSGLFTDVLNCMQTNNLELKKLVYLYVMNYAKTHPKKAILAVNTFQKDASDANPLIRALAIRTMGCIRLDKITEYLCEPLASCLKDRDPYVLKTAAVCVAKLYDINPQLVEDQGFLEMLRDLLSDSNPMVVANAVAALTEIDDIAPNRVFKINSNNRNKLLAALEECTEWGQVYILNSLAKYTPKDARHAQNIADRVIPRLQHSNSAVVLAAIKVLIKYCDIIESDDAVGNILKKMSPPLVTLLSKQPEIQYVALRNINLILQKYPNLLRNEVKVFFCKYNDPIYVKMEKLEIMIMLARESNIEQVLLELKEYATAVDVEFVRKAVRAIGRCAIKLEKASEKCIHVLLDLIKTRVNYVVQETVIVIKDIFRKYPNRYESIISILCENLESLDEPEAKASMIWIIGEYAERITQADELLDSFLEGFKEENAQVQLQLLTAIVKLFLKRPKDTQSMVQEVLNLATQESDNPDLRDRGFIYWRLLSTDPEAAKQVVLSDKPEISDHSEKLEESVLDELLGNISSLASVYHKPPETFVTKLKGREPSSLPKKKKKSTSSQQLPQQEKEETSSGGIGNLLDVGDVSTPNVQSKSVPKMEVLSAANGKGLSIHAAFQKSGQGLVLEMKLTNATQGPVSDFQIEFNKNTFRIKPTQRLNVDAVYPGQSVECSLPVGVVGDQSDAPPSNAIQMAIKTSLGIFYFNVPLALHVLFSPDGKIGRDEYLSSWKSIPKENEKYKDITNVFSYDVNQVRGMLEAHNIFFVASRKDNNKNILYLSAKTPLANLLLEISIDGGSSCRLCTKTTAMFLAPFVEMSVAFILAP